MASFPRMPKKLGCHDRLAPHSSILGNNHLVRTSWFDDRIGEKVRITKLFLSALFLDVHMLCHRYSPLYLYMKQITRLIYIYTYVHVHICIHMYIYVYIYIYIYIYVCVCVCVYVCVCLCVCMCVCVRALANIYMYIYI